MDPVSGTASVLTLLSFALASTKFIHHAVSSVQNGPAHLNIFVRDVETLQKVLAQFEAYQSQAPSSGVDLEIVSSLISACNDDLLRYKAKIGKAYHSTGNKVDLLWKRIKLVVCEKDIRIMQQEIHHHSTKLGHQLTILQQ